MHVTFFRLAVTAILCSAASLLSAGSPSDLADTDWPEFRGPTGQGHSPAVGLPVTWSETENIAWKVAIPVRGWSTPLIRGDRIWITTADADGKTLRALCLDRESAATVHNVVIGTLTEKGAAHEKNTLASPTPVLDGERVYVHFGPHATACLSHDGKILWRTELAHKQSYGPSSSPVLYGDLLIVPCLGTDVRYFGGSGQKDGGTTLETGLRRAMCRINAAGDPHALGNGADQQPGGSHYRARPGHRPRTVVGYSGEFRPGPSTGLRPWPGVCLRRLLQAGSLGDSSRGTRGRDREPRRLAHQPIPPRTTRHRSS